MLHLLNYKTLSLIDQPTFKFEFFNAAKIYNILPIPIFPIFVNPIMVVSLNSD